MFERSEACLKSGELARLGVPHAFTTRRLDVGPLDEELAAELRGLAGVGPGVPVLAPRQVHGAAVLEVDAECERLAVGGTPADAVWTRGPGALLLIRTADCVPILVAAAGGERVAAIHAGWRGLVGGVIPSALSALRGQGLGGALVAAIGPCLSRRRFEVGEEVAAAFEAADLASVVHRGPGAKPRVDLAAAASIQLERAGVARIDVAGLCTWDEGARSGELGDAGDFWSYRRDVTRGGRAHTGRLAALVAAPGT